jgi:hypothetical protein
MKANTEPKDQVSERTEPVNKVDVQREFQKLFGPQVMGSDRHWDCLELTAATHWVLSPIRDLIKDAARKHRDNPSAFQRKFEALYKVRVRELARDSSQRERFARYIEVNRRVHEDLTALFPAGNRGAERVGGLPTLPNDISPVKLKALNEILLAFQASWTGPLFPGTGGRKVIEVLIENLRKLLADNSGRPKKDWLDTAYKLYESKEYHGGRRSPIHYICAALVPGFPSMKVSDQTRWKRQARSGIERRKEKHVTKPPTFS